jgi:hypothetical protein
MLSDEELVQKTLNGDTKAYEELFQRYSSGVMGVYATVYQPKK